jgi:hypothetical protein
VVAVAGILAVVLVRPAPAPGQQTEPSSDTATGVGEVQSAVVDDLTVGDARFDAWSRTQRTYETSEPGTFLTEFYDAPVNAHHGDEWTEIRPSLEPGGDLGFRASTPLLNIEVAPNASAGAVGSVHFADGTGVSFALLGAADASATVSSRSVEYSDVAPSTSMELETLPAGLKETIVLADSSAPNEFRFSLQTVGLTPSVEHGAVVFRADDGSASLIVPPGYMEDSSAERSATYEGVRYGLNADGSVLTLTLDEMWLEDPDRVYPVFVDPSLLIYGNSEDTYVTQGTTANNSSALTINVGRGASGNFNRGFLRFNTGALEDMNVHEATLNLWQATAASCTPTPTDVYAVNDEYPWTNDTSWPGPSLDGEVFSTTFESASGYSGSCPAGVVSADITRIVGDWASDQAANEGLGLRAHDESTYGQFKKFASADTYTPPSLTVVWSDPTLTGAPSIPDQLSPSGTVTSSQPVLSARYSDPQSDPGKLVFRTYDGATGSLLDTFISAQLSSGSTATATIDPVPLDGDVEWTVTARDVNGTKYSRATDPLTIERPAVYISAPSSDSTVSTSSAVDAQLGTGISATSVDFYLNDDLVASDNTSPFSAAGIFSSITESSYYRLTAQIVGGSYDGSESPMVGVFFGEDTDPILSTPTDETGTPESAGFHNMMPTSSVDDCFNGLTSGPATGSPCRSDNSRLSVHFQGNLLGMDIPTRRALWRSISATRLNVVYREHAVYEDEHETDVIYRLSTVDDNSFYGWTFCDDSSLSHNRCDQTYVTYNRGEICGDGYCDHVNDRDNRRAIACHETAHTVGLVHGSDADTPSGQNISDSDTRLNCLRNGVSPSGSYNKLGTHNNYEINNYYPA